MAYRASYDTYDNDIQEFEQLVASRYRQGSRGSLSDSAHDAGCRYLLEDTLEEFFQDKERLMRILRRLFTHQENPRLFSNILERIREGEYRKVFAILLLIRRGPAIKYFIEDPDLRDAKLPFDNPQKFPDQASDPIFFDDFRRHQPMFCVEKLRYRDFVKLSGDQILPYKIERYLASGVSCKAFVIEVDPQYNELYNSSKRQPDANPHTFVLKTFENEIPDGKEQYDQELNSFASILHAGNDPNIVSFFGSFKHGDTFNIILEYANEGTLEDLMQNTQPPKKPEHLYELWGALLKLLQGLTTLHNLNFPSEDGFSTFESFICHYDLKPRNILVFVRRDDTYPIYKFKLADLGLSKLKMKVRANKQSLAAAGIRTYGAPELYDAFDGVNFPPLQAGPEVDIWSIGCVFSEAATWILGGCSGLENFREMRSHAHQDMAPQSSDCFHDGLQLLPCVAEHHASLREQTPSHDPLTKGVLGMVEEHMLVDKHKRFDASTLFRKANQMYRQYRTMRSSSSVTSPSGSSPNIPSSFNPSTSVAGVENIHAWHTHTSLPSVMHDGWGYNARGQVVAACIQPHDDGNAQQSPPLRPFPTDRPYFPSQRFTAPESTPPVHHTSFPRQGFHTTKPPVQIFDRANPVHHLTAFQRHILPSNSHPRRALQGNSAATERYFAESQFGDNINLAQRSPPFSVIANPSRANHMRSVSSGSWSQEASSHQQYPSAGESSTQSHIPTSPATRPNLPYFPVDLVHQRRINRRPLLEGYTHDLVDRDFVFLVDNSSSMRPHWPQIQNCVSILGYEVKRFDKDGIEICFTLSSVKKKHKKTSPLVDEVKRHLPADPLTNPQTKTNIYTSLGSMLDQYRTLIEQPGNVKKKIIFVLTDGLWQPHSAEYLEHSLRNLISSLSQTQSPMDQIGIQFIQFGRDPVATQLLRYLDKMHGLGIVERDIVDCELYHAKGNVWKMLMGSINRWADDDEDINNHDELTPNSKTASTSVPNPHPPPPPPPPPQPI